MAYEKIYKGSKSSLDPVYSGIPSGIIGGTTSIQTANQLQEASNLLNTGMKNVEISMVDPNVFDMIPKEQFKEINRLSKLTGAEASFHAPVQGMEPSGFDDRGQWSEHKRQDMERQIIDTLKRVKDMNPEGGMPVTIHASSVIPGEERIPISLIGKENLTEGEKKYISEGSVPIKNIFVNQESGKIVSFEREKKYTTEAPEGKIFTPDEEAKKLNEDYWKDKLSQILYYKERGSEMLQHVEPILRPELDKVGGIDKFRQQVMNDPEKFKSQVGLLGTRDNAEIYLKNSQRMLDEAFNEAYKSAGDKGKEELQKISNKFSQDLKEYEKDKDVSKYNSALQGFMIGMSNLAMTKGLTPEVFKPIEEFAIEKASQTFANAAFKAVEESGSQAPMISIENPPYGGALSDARNLKKLIDVSRDKLAKRLTNQGMSESEAKKRAESMIGATWDTSHSSMMRKQGFTTEDLKKQAEIIAPMVKHVHLNDNLGFTHTDIAPGMGDVPLKEIMAEFKSKGFKGKSVFEGGQFFQHFKTSPHPYVLANMDSPMYSSGAGPVWSAPYSRMGAYSSGYGPFLPEQHFSMYGAGFSSLPQELGGQIARKNSNFSGTPME